MPRNIRKGRKRRKKVCAFCADARGRIIDYKNVNLLSRHLDDRGKIRKARTSGTCRKHARKLAIAMKRAREMALLPYSID